MTLFNITELFARVPQGRRLIGLDLGARRVGVALSDISRIVATPHAVWPRGKLAGLATAISALARREGAGGLVVGWPLSMDGSVGPAAQAARDVSHALAAATGLPTALADERLSTAAANRMLIDDADLSRQRRAEVVDAIAAAWVLQGVLDSAANPSTLRYQTASEQAE